MAEREMKKLRATGKPATADAVGEMSYLLIRDMDMPMSLTTTTLFSLVHVLGVELAEALRRIEELERRMPHVHGTAWGSTTRPQKAATHEGGG